MRNILYSPGFGAGWVSWYSGTREQKMFMMTHPGLIEAANKLDNNSDDPVDPLVLEEAKETLKQFLEDYSYRNLVGTCKPVMLVAIAQFCKDWKVKFPDKDLPYLGGAHQLSVYRCEDDEVVRIEEYDGHESVTVQSDVEWY